MGFKQASGDTQPATSDFQSIPRTGTSYSCLKVLLAFFLPTGQATVTEDATIEKEKSDLNKFGWYATNSNLLIFELQDGVLILVDIVEMAKGCLSQLSLLWWCLFCWSWLFICCVMPLLVFVGKGIIYYLFAIPSRRWQATWFTFGSDCNFVWKRLPLLVVKDKELLWQVNSFDVKVWFWKGDYLCKRLRPAPRVWSFVDNGLFTSNPFVVLKRLRSFAKVYLLLLIVYVVWVLKDKESVKFLYSNVFHFCISWFCNDSDHLQKFTSSPRLHSLGFKDKESIKSERNKREQSKDRLLEEILDGCGMWKQQKIGRN